MSKHVQVHLQKGTTHMVAWIPTHCAKPGALVDLKDPEHGKTTDWTVLTVGGTQMDSKWISERDRDCLQWRSVTDI